MNSNSSIVGTMVRRGALLSAVALVALAAPSYAAAPAIAAQADQDQPVAPDSDSEIIVTASKLGSNLDRAPVAVTVLDASVLQRENIISLNGIALRTPSLSYDSPTNFAQAYIRGIGSLFLLSGLESSVATYIDGAYVQRQAGAVLDVVDVADISVLKGPQGTLYGRNATGGAILMQTADPVNRLEGNATFRYGRFNDARADAAFNVPLSSTVAIRVAGQVGHSEGFINNTGVVNGKKLGRTNTVLGRFKIAWNPSSDFNAIYSFEYNKRDSTAYGIHQRFTDARCLACVIYGVTPSQESFYDATVGPDNPPNTVTSYLNLLRMNLTLGDVTISSITSNRNLHVGTYNESDITSAQFADATVIEKGPTFTQDVYAKTNFDGPLNVLVGASYERDRGNLATLLEGGAYGPFPVTNLNKVNLDSYSGYGEVYFKFGNGFKLTGGARYNVDKKRIEAVNDPSAIAFFASLGGAIPATYSKDATFKAWTPRGVLSYEQGGGYYYASYSRGVKSGGFSTPSFPPPAIIQDEVLDNFEIGAKNSFFDGRVRTQVAAFIGKFKNIQVARVGPAGVETQNAASADVKGIEADVQWKATDDLSLSIGGTYLHNRFTDYPAAAIVVETGTFPALANSAANLKGAPLPRSPNWAGYANMNYDTEMQNGWRVNTSLTARYTSEFDFYAGRGGSLGLDFQKAYVMVNGSLTFTIPSGDLDFGIYGENLTNHKYFVTASTTTFGSQYVPAKPATYGFRATKRF